MCDSHILVKSQVRSLQYDGELLFSRCGDQIVYQSHIPGVLCREKLGLSPLEGIQKSAINVNSICSGANSYSSPIFNFGAEQFKHCVCSILYVDEYHCYCCLQELSNFKVSIVNVVNGQVVSLGDPTTSSIQQFQQDSHNYASNVHSKRKFANIGMEQEELHCIVNSSNKRKRHAK